MKIAATLIALLIGAASVIGVVLSTDVFHDEVELRIAAKTHEDGRVEFAALHNGEYILPASRLYTPNSETTEWAHSSPITLSDNRGLHTGELITLSDTGSQQGLRIDLARGRWTVRLSVLADDNDGWFQQDHVDAEITDDVGNTVRVSPGYGLESPFDYQQEMAVGPGVSCWSDCVSAGELTVEIDASDDEQWTLTFERIVE